MIDKTRKETFAIRSAVQVAVVALISNPAFAIESKMQMNGAGFSDACTRIDEAWVSFCNGYVQAVIDGMADEEKICLPTGTTRTDIVTITEKEITASAQLQAMNANDAIRSVLSRYYSCR